MSEISPVVVDRPCPKCRKEKVVHIEGNTLACKSDGCEFTATYGCPVCGTSIPSGDFHEAQGLMAFDCRGCQSKISTRKVKYLVDNALYVDTETVCDNCNGPTLHRKDVNMAHRCFFYPKCSGQVDLFHTEHETLTFLDFETTGLEVGKDSIIEIGALKIDKSGTEHTFETFVKPLDKIQPHIQNITGISNDMVQNAPDLKTSLQKLIDFIGDSKIVAHNADFDLPWLVTGSLRHDISLNAEDVVCTLVWARQSKEGSCSLGALTKKYGIAHSNAHRALADAVATKELFKIFQEKYGNTRPKTPVKTYLEKGKSICEKYPDVCQP